MKTTTRPSSIAVLACAIGACSPSSATFVESPAAETKTTTMTTHDGRVRISLATGLAWSEDAKPDVLLRVKAKEGPTYVVVAAIAGVSAPLDVDRCAEAHRAQILVATAAQGIAITDPSLTHEIHHGASLPRLVYAAPLEAHGDAVRASVFSAWTYLVDGDRCVGVGATTIVHAKPGSEESPDPEDIDRLERVFATLADGTQLVTK